MTILTRSGRRTAVAVAVLAVTGAATTAVIAGTASAAGTGTCTSTVNVRSQPSATAPVVGSCEQGQSTRVGETRNGFVKLDEFGGWASAQYVSTGTAGRTAPNQTTGREGRGGASAPEGTGSERTPGTSRDGGSADRGTGSTDRDADRDADTGRGLIGN